VKYLGLALRTAFIDALRAAFTSYFGEVKVVGEQGHFTLLGSKPGFLFTCSY